MMQPLAGQAATASGTPPEYRSAKRTLERFCILTTPPASVICELASPPPEYLGITLTEPTRPVIADVGSLEEAGAAAGATAGTGTEVATGTLVTVCDVLCVSEVLCARMNAEAGSPPKVCASPALTA